MKKKNTTIVDIANKLDIDISTVSRALKDHPKISDNTKQKVKKVAKELNYRPNNIAAALVKGSSNLLGVMVPHTDENFFASVIRGIEEVAKENGYRIIIFQSNDNAEDEIENIEIMYQTKVDGILASHAMATENFDHFKEITDQGIPLVLFDRFNESVDSDIVAIDDFKGAYMAVEHLIEQGCKTIVKYSGYQNVHIYKERVRGYKQALSEHNLPYEKSYIFESDLTLNSGREITSKLIEEQQLPDAIFASNDYAALGAMQVLKEHNIEIPKQVAIIGFSNEAFTSYVSPGISSIDQHSRRIGKIAAETFVKKIQTRSEDYKDVPSKTLLTPELVIRGSSLRTG